MGGLNVLPARTAVAVRVAANDVLEVVNTEGAQVVDVWAFCPDDVREHLSMEHSHLHMARVSPKVGDALVTNRRREALRLVADDSGGVHDTLLAACDRERYRLLGYYGEHANCRDNLHRALRTAGVRTAATPCPLNLFERAPVGADGRIDIEAPRAPPGSRVALSATRPLIVVLSACPQDLVPANGADCRPKPVAWRVRGAEAGDAIRA